MTPFRIQLSRRKGWRMPADTVSVSRPGKWGNPYRVREADGAPEYGIVLPAITAEQAVAMHREWLIDALWRHIDLLEPLRGKNIGCWCALGQPCHGDTYLELANLPRGALIKRMLECRKVA